MLTVFWIFTGIMLFIGIVVLIITLLGIWGIPMDPVENLIINDWFIRIFLTALVIVGLLAILFGILSQNA